VFIPMPMGIFNNQQEVVVDLKGYVYVANTSYETIHVYDKKGNFIQRVKSTYSFFLLGKGGVCLSVDYKGRVWLENAHTLRRIIYGYAYWVDKKRIPCIPEKAWYCDEPDTENYKLDDNGELIITEPNRVQTYNHVIRPGEYLFPGCLPYSPNHIPFVDKDGRVWRTKNFPLPHVVVKEKGKVIKRIYGSWWLIPVSFLSYHGLIMTAFVLYFLYRLSPRYCEGGEKKVEEDKGDAEVMNGSSSKETSERRDNRLER